MLVRLQKTIFPRLIPFSLRGSPDLFLMGVFLYFFTLHADQLHLVLQGLTFRLNNLLALLLVGALLIRREVKVLNLPRHLAYAILALTCALFVSCVCSPYKGRCLAFLGWYSMTLLCYLWLPYVLFQLFALKRILQLYFGSFLAVGSLALLQGGISLCGAHVPFASQIIKGTFVRPNAFAYEPSFYALYMTPFVVLATLHYFLQKREDFFIFRTLTKKKLAYIHLLFLLSTATSTIFAYLVFFLVTAALLLFTKWKTLSPHLGKAVLKGGLLFLCMLLFLWLAFPSLAKHYYFKFFIQDFRSHHSFFERWAGIVNAWTIFIHHPWVGVGLGGIPPFLYDAWTTGEKAYLFLFQEQWITDYGRALKFFEPSNVFTEVLASVGIVGVSAFLFGIISYAKLVHTAQKVVQDPFLRNWIMGFFVSVLVSLIVLQFNQGVFRTYIWVHFAIAFAFTEKALSYSNGTTQLYREALFQEG